MGGELGFMSVTIDELCDEIGFLETTARDILKELYDDWYINAYGFAELDISDATDKQKGLLLKRFGGYEPRIVGDKLMLNFDFLIK